MALNYGDKMDVVWLYWAFWMIHGDDKHSLTLDVKYKVYSPFGPYTLSAPSHTPPLWRTKGLLEPWWGCSQSHGVMTSVYLISITAVIKDFEEEEARSDTKKKPLGMEMLDWNIYF